MKFLTTIIFVSLISLSFIYIQDNEDKRILKKPLLKSTSDKEIVKPANGHASVSTQNLLAWLHGLPKRDRNKILIGQFCGYPNPKPELLSNIHPWSTFTPKYMEDIHAMTGKYPAIMGVDYYGNSGGIDEGPGIVTTEHSHKRTLNYNNISGKGINLNQALIKWWKSGGLVTINIHSYRPDTHRPDNSGELMKFGKGGGDKRFP